MERKFTLKYDDAEKFYRAYVALLKPFLRGIRDREADIFAQLLYYNYKRRHIPDKEDRFKLILGPDSRQRIVEKLNITPAIFRNGLTGLRKIGLLKEDNSIADVYLIEPTDKRFVLEFTFFVEN